MYKKLIALSLISAFALSACGGGSDDSGTAQPNNNNSVTNHYPSDSQTNNSQQSHDEQPQEQGSEAPFDMQMQAVVYKFQTDNNQDIISSSTSPIYQKHDGDSNDDSYKQMLINGKTVIFKETGNREDGWIDYMDDDGVEYVIPPTQTSRGTAYARYGWSVHYDTHSSQFFFQGKPTQINDMPKTGIATYQGYVLGFNPVEANLNIDGGGEYYGLSEFNVDFANKQLTGTLDNWKSKSSKPDAINIKAEIRANTFQGTANKTGYAEGKFYGPAAQNLAGAFEDKNQNLHGVFGANKQ